MSERRKNSIAATPFDAQAATFDHRVGLPAVCREQVAEAVLAIAKLQAGDLLVEVGAGTGQIGAELARSYVRYLGFDISEEMLAVFWRCMQADAAAASADNWTLLQADGNQRWPVADGSARAIFSSRAMHLLEPDRVIDESFRVAHPAGATLSIGRVQRRPDSIKAILQKQMQALLAKRGWRGRDGKQAKSQLLTTLRQRGAAPRAAVVAARWVVEHSPARSLESWRSKSGLGGIETIPTAEKEAILTLLADWAAEKFGDLARAIVTEETYVIDSVCLPITAA